MKELITAEWGVVAYFSNGKRNQRGYTTSKGKEQEKEKKKHKDGNVNFGYFFSGFSRSKLQLLHF